MTDGFEEMDAYLKDAGKRMNATYRAQLEVVDRLLEVDEGLQPHEIEFIEQMSRQLRGADQRLMSRRQHKWATAIATRLGV